MYKQLPVIEAPQWLVPYFAPARICLLFAGFQHIQSGNKSDPLLLVTTFLVIWPALVVNIVVESSFVDDIAVSVAGAEQSFGAVEIASVHIVVVEERRAACYNLQLLSI